MTLSRVTQIGALLAIALLALGGVFLGNQRQANAATINTSLTGQGQMTCIVYTEKTVSRDFNFPAFTYENGCPGQETTPPAPQCSNSKDDDGDGLIDSADPACHTDGNASNASSYNPSLNNEALSVPQCKDGLDNDGDGKKDYPADPGCSSPTDNDETDPVDNGGGGNNGGGGTTLPQCSNSKDDDADGLVDSADPACHTDGNAANASSYDPLLNNESLSVAQCKDGLDNDSDTKIDSADPNCHTDGNPSNADSYDPNRSESDELPACANGKDDDGDGLVDMDDPGCSSATDNDEKNSSGGGGHSSGGGGGGGSGSAIAQQVVGTVLGTSTPPYVAPNESCDQYLYDFIKVGRNNNSEQVKRLQYVLHDFEGFANVGLTGTYDAATLAAVHAFQTKYASEILIPWGIKQSTGFVYLTTRKKINEIYCHSTNQFPLTQAEQRIIDTARGESVPASPSTANTNTEGAGSSTTTQTGSVGEAAKSIWDRIKSFFGQKGAGSE